MMNYNKYLFPSTVVIEPTNVCNLHCKMCNARCSVVKDLKKYELTPENLEIMLEKLKGYIINIVFQGDCEPSLNKRLPELVRVASKYTKEVCIVSNGTLLTEQLVDELVENGLTFFSISIDDYRRLEYNKIRVGAEFNNVIKNLDYITKLKKEKNNNIRTLVHKVVFPEDTVEDMKKYIEFFLEHSIDKITIAPLAMDFKIKDWVIFRNTIENEFMENDLYLNLRDYENYPYRSAHKYYCGTNLIFIDYLGNLKACPLHSASENNFGNLLTESLDKIEQNECFKEYHEFWLEKKFSNNLPKMCDNCFLLNTDYYGYCLDDGVNAINIFKNNSPLG